MSTSSPISFDMFKTYLLNYIL